MKVPRPIRLVGVGSVLLLMLLLVVVGYLLALHFYRTRADFRGKSDYKDLEIFLRSNHPQRTSRFDKLPAANPYASQIDAIARHYQR